MCNARFDNQSRISRLLHGYHVLRVLDDRLPIHQLQEHLHFAASEQVGSLISNVGIAPHHFNSFDPLPTKTLIFTH